MLQYQKMLTFGSRSYHDMIRDMKTLINKSILNMSLLFFYIIIFDTEKRMLKTIALIILLLGISLT